MIGDAGWLNVDRFLFAWLRLHLPEINRDLIPAFAIGGEDRVESVVLRFYFARRHNHAVMKAMHADVYCACRSHDRFIAFTFIDFVFTV